MNVEFGGAIAWRPTREYIERSRLKAFIDRHGLGDYPDVLRRSIADPVWFWPAVLDDLGIEFYEPYQAENPRLAASGEGHRLVVERQRTVSSSASP